MAFTTNITGTSEIPEALIQLWDTTVYVAAQQEDVVSQFANEVEIAGGSLTLPIYSNLAVGAALTEKDDVVSEALAETAVVVTPVEEGKAITTSSLAQLKSGGNLQLAAFRSVGANMGRTKNARAVAALEASTNVVSVGGKAEGSILATDVLDLVTINKAYNKLARESATKIGGAYVAFAHDDVLFDLRSSSGWVDVAKYADPSMVLANEIGMFGGFRFIRNNDCSYADQTGAGLVDVYKTSFLGADGLVYGYSKAPGMTITGPFDKLGRMVNIGWYGVFQYKIYNSKNVAVALSASSVGANAA